MDYAEGDIVYRTGIKFKGTSKLDFRMAGHPIVILKGTDFEEEYVYFLTMSSQTHCINAEPDRYYQVNKDRNNKLRKASIIDLKYVYKLNNINIVSCAYLSEEDYEKMLSKMRLFTEIEKDDDFNEISDKLGM